MILIAELTWTGTIHAPGNSATVQTVARAFPEQAIRVCADPSHLAELRRDPALTAHSNVDFRPAALSPLHRGKTHVVSGRRFLREFATLRAALGEAPDGEGCLLLLISATPTAIFAAALLARLTRRVRLGVQVGLHGNLNEIGGWRPRNPLTRRFDLASAMSARHPPGLRFLVLEPAIRDALAERSPGAAARTDVLPLPVNTAEMPALGGARRSGPLRVGFVGQATQAKGFDVFLAIAQELKARYGERIAFHLVGRAMPGADLAALAVLEDAAGTEHLPREAFIARLAALDYVLLPFREGYYDLSASGALIDAITWLKPIIATRVPLVRHFFETYGDIGFLCDGSDELRRAVEAALSGTEPGRYDAQVAAVARAREARRPEALARAYRAIVHDGFSGLLPTPGQSFEA